MSFDDEMRDERKARYDLGKVQAMLLDAAKLGWPEFYVEPPESELTSGTCHRLTRPQTDMAVRLAVSLLNLSGGSVGSVQLYDTLYGYLTDETFREEVNAGYLRLEQRRQDANLGRARS